MLLVAPGFPLRYVLQQRRMLTAADQQRYPDPGWFVEGAEITRTAYEAHKEDDDFVRPGTLCGDVMTTTDRDHLAATSSGT